MSRLDELSDALTRRDSVEQQLLPYFAAFESASRRATLADETSTSTEPPPSSAEGGAPPADSNDIVDRLKASRSSLEKQLRTLQTQLDKAQERARAVAEEQYLKTNAVQGLHDEILALTVQLNLSEERRKRLQDELGR